MFAHRTTRPPPPLPKPPFIELGDGSRLPILYEDRSVLAIDKPAGWMLVPYSWQNTQRNLHAALVSSIAEGGYWARSRGIKFLRHVHRLDADTSGVLLLARSQGAMETLSELFETRRMEKVYLAAVEGEPVESAWECHSKLGPVPGVPGRMRVDEREGKDAETHFRVLARRGGRALIQARPVTGRTHQIRLHLLASKHPVAGDTMYGKKVVNPRPVPLGLRAMELRYTDPFTRRRVDIRAPAAAFLAQFNFTEADLDAVS